MNLCSTYWDLILDERVEMPPSNDYCNLRGLYKNPNVTWDDLHNPMYRPHLDNLEDLPSYIWSALSQNPNITWDIVSSPDNERYIDMWDWAALSFHKNIDALSIMTSDNISDRKYDEYWHTDMVYANPNTSYNDILAALNNVLFKRSTHIINERVPSIVVDIEDLSLISYNPNFPVYYTDRPSGIHATGNEIDKYCSMDLLLKLYNDSEYIDAIRDISSDYVKLNILKKTISPRLEWDQVLDSRNLDILKYIGVSELLTHKSVNWDIVQRGINGVYDRIFADAEICVCLYDMMDVNRGSSDDDDDDNDSESDKGNNYHHTHDSRCPSCWIHYFSMNPNLTIDIITAPENRRYINLWNSELISSNPGITFDDIEESKKLDYIDNEFWSWHGMSRNPNLLFDDIVDEEFSDMWNSSGIVSNHYTLQNKLNSLHLYKVKRLQRWITAEYQLNPYRLSARLKLEEELRSII